MLHGIDVSHWQRFSNYNILNEKKQAFVFIKASEGLRADPSYHLHQSAFAKTALLTGAYHFMRFNSQYSGTQQAQAFINTVGQALPEMSLPPVLDIEDVSENLPVEDCIALVRQWIDTVKTKYGVTPIIYTGAWYWNDPSRMNKTTEFKNCPLWVSAYTRKYPPPFGGWDKPTFWQYSGSGTIDGLAGDKAAIDLNYFLNDAEVLWGMMEPNSVPKDFKDLKDKAWAVQYMLQKKTDPNLKIDGNFGTKSIAALNKWQSDNGIPITTKLDPTQWQLLFDWGAPEPVAEIPTPPKVGAIKFPEVGFVNADLLNIRKGAGADHALIASPLPKGQQLTVMEEANGWYKVKTTIEGWVSKSLVQINS